MFHIIKRLHLHIVCTDYINENKGNEPPSPFVLKVIEVIIGELKCLKVPFVAVVICILKIKWFWEIILLERKYINFRLILFCEISNEGNFNCDT